MLEFKNEVMSRQKDKGKVTFQEKIGKLGKRG